MQGFFTKEEVQSKSRPDGKVYSCASCGLYQFKLNPRMEAFGNGKLGILNVGESPNEKEDERGKQWQGKVGRKLRVMYRHLGVDLFEDCWNINAANCRPTSGTGANRAPTDYEIACCRARVLKVIDECQPKVIVVFGNSPILSLLGHRWKKDLGGITKWRGWTIPDRDFNAWVCPTFHPSYVDRQSAFPEVELIWQQDLERAISMVGRPLPNFQDDKQGIHIIDNQDELKTVLEKIDLGWEGDLISFDYETTGLKPHAKGHKIVCCSISTGTDKVYSFMFPTRKHQLIAFRRLMANPDIGKMAHNMKFEHAWTEVKVKSMVQNWVWDSMQAAHILDNRPGITKLKFQTYVNLGVVDYDSHIAPFLEGVDKKNANSMNRIFEFIDRYGEKELLTYCGLDSLYQHRLAMGQMCQLGFRPKSNPTVLV